MKRFFALVLCSLMLLSLCACTLSEEGQAIDTRILQLGRITLDSGEEIEELEVAVEALSSMDQRLLENKKILEDARIIYDGLVEERNLALIDETEKAIDKIGKVTLNSGARIDKAAALYDALEPDLQERVANRDAFLTARETLLELQADEIRKAIDAIGTVTWDSYEAIQHARSVYDSYDADAQALVENAGLLTDAEERIHEIRIGDTEKAIDKIGKVTLQKEQAIWDARALMDALTEEERGIVSNGYKLYDACTAFNELKSQALLDAKNDALTRMTIIDGDTTKTIKPNVMPQYVNTRTQFLPAVGLVKEDGSGLMVYRAVYHGSNWVFFEKLIFNVDGEEFVIEYDFFDIEHSAKGAGVTEYIITQATDEHIEMFRKIAVAKKVTIRYQGDDDRYDFTMPEADRACFADALAVYDALNYQGTFPE